MSGFFEELQRRKVYRVAAAYIIAAGFIIQIGSAVFPAWELPNWTLRLVVVLLLMGFPIALILAWAYDVTPQGIRVTPGSNRRRNLLMLIASGVIISAGAGFFLLPRASARKIDKSIAVLPFQSLSDEKENAYFADGIQDDILTNLSKIGELKVISRMSVMSYRGDAVRNAREIGKALGVATLLEGSVRRIGNRVRVNVQLIDANNDEHIWAEDYDRDLTDVFAIQTDLAQKIASALQAKLSPTEKARLDNRPTQNPDAYLLFVQAHDDANRMHMFHDTSSKAVPLFEQAIKLDPNFALAFAGLSMAQSWIYHSFDPIPTWRDKARLNANEALRLQPDLPEGHLALGFCYYYGDRDYERALAEFEIARRDLPNEAQAYLAIGAIQRRQDKWAESTANLEKAAALDPKNTDILSNLVFSYMAQRKFETADKTLDRVIAAEPQSLEAALLKGGVAILWKGDLSVAENQLSSVPPEADRQGLITGVRVGILTLARKFPEALELLQKFPGETLTSITTAPCPKAFLEGTIYLLQGDETKAQPQLEQARVVSEKLLSEAPEDPGRHAQYGLILAALGRKQEAIAQGKRAVELLPESQDAFDGPQYTAALAQIYAWTGEPDEAFRLLDHLLSVPNGLVVPMLKLDPVWDPLRKDPRYQALIDKVRTEELTRVFSIDMKDIFGLSIPQTLEEVCDPQRVALLVYDMQIGILSQIKNGDEVTRQVLKVLTAARNAGVRVFFSRHLSLPNELMGMSQFRMAMAWQRVDSPDQVNPWFLRDAPGFQIVPELSPLPTEGVFDKLTMSALEGTWLDFALRDCGINAFIIVGVATEIGIEPTARHGADLGYIPLLVTDACGAGSEEAAKRSIESLKFAGDALIADTETICDVLGKRSTVSNA